MILDSFFVALGFEVDTSKVEQFNQQAKALRTTILEVGAVAIGAAAGIGLLSIGVAQSLGELQKFAELNDISARSVAAFGKIATENDSSLDAVKDTIQGLNRVAGEAALGIGRGAMTFEKLGMNAKDVNGKVKTFDVLLGEISDKMVGLSQMERLAMAAKLGIDPTMVNLLKKGSTNLAELREEAEGFIPFTEQQYKLANEVDKLYNKAKGSIGIFTKIIGASLLPLAKQVLQTYMAWFKESRKATSGAVTTGLQILIGVLGTMWDWTMRIVSAVKGMYDMLSKIPGITYIVIAAFAVLAALKTYEVFNNLIGALRAVRYGMMAFGATISPVAVLVGGLILAIGLLIDDFINFREGNDSLIGSLAEKFPIVLQVVNALSDGIEAFFEFWKEGFNQLSGPLSELGAAIFDLVKVIVSSLWPVVKGIAIVFLAVLSVVVPIIAKVVKLIAEDLVFAVKGWVMILTGLVEIVTGIFSFITGIVEKFISFWIAAWSVVFSGLKKAFDGAVSIVESIIGVVAGFFATVGSMAQASIAVWMAVFSMIGEIVTGIFDGLVSVVSSLFLGFETGLDAVLGGVQSAFGFITGLIDSAKANILGFVDMIVGAVSKVTQFFGLTNGKSTVTAAQAPASPATTAPATMAALSQIPGLAPASTPNGSVPVPFSASPQSAALAPSGGVLGAGSNVRTSTVSNSTTISGTQITVQSPDPARAGESVVDALDRMNRQNIRNGQSAVAI